MIVGLRPEDFHVAPAAAATTAPVDLVTIATEVLGPEVILVASLASGDGPEIHARMPRDFRAKLGEPVTLHFDLSEIQVFDPDIDPGARAPDPSLDGAHHAQGRPLAATNRSSR